MIGTIRRHQKWLWAIIITVTIISFVVFFSPTSNMGPSAPTEYGTMNGRSIRRDEFIDAYHEAQLRYFFSNREWPDEVDNPRQRGFDINREARSRLFLIDKLKEFNIYVGDEVVAQRIAELFQDRDTRSFRPEGYERFVKERLGPKGISKKDLHRFLRHEVGIQQLVSVIGLPGRLVTTNEAIALFQTENEQLATQAGFFSTSNYLAKVIPDPRAIGEFYTNRQALYRFPNRMQLNYVKFEITNFFAHADQKIAEDTNLTFKIENFYQQQGTDAFKNAADQVLTAEAAKEKIKSDIRRDYALIEARRKANEFATELFDLSPARAENLTSLAAKHNLMVQETPPFAQRESPPNLKVPEQFNKVAFNLTEQEPFGIPVVAEDGVYVLALKRKVPSELPPFEVIREQVTSGYLNYHASALARQAGSNFVERATNALAQSKPFEVICQEANVPLETPPLFSITTRSLPEIEKRVSLNEFKSVALALTPGHLSPFVPTREGGFVLYLKAKVPVTADKIKSDFPDFLRDLRLTRQYQVFNEWFRKEADKAKVFPPEAPAPGPEGGG